MLNAANLDTNHAWPIFEPNSGFEDGPQVFRSVPTFTGAGRELRWSGKTGEIDVTIGRKIGVAKQLFWFLCEGSNLHNHKNNDRGNGNRSHSAVPP
jgi:hypothetical protein